jgi:hypothetical protein
MDDLTLLRSFRAERADGDPRPRAAARRDLEARFGWATVPPGSRPDRSHRRGLLALAAVGALAAALAAILVIGSGPNAEPAAAEVLRRIASVAADTPPEARPGPDQFLYRRTKTLELQSWIPGSRQTSMGGVINRPGALTALVPVEREFWMSPEGAGRSREVLGTLQFLSEDEMRRWEKAGSTLPGHFESNGQDTILGHNVEVLESGGGVVDIELPQPPKGRELGPNFGFPDVSGLPTEPEALRLAVQNRQAGGSGEDAGGKPADVEATILGLWGILQQPIIDPQLRAAAFNALSELPGIGLDRDATDLAGRPGYAISYLDRQTGLRGEYIFDPTTSAILGERTVLVDPQAIPANEAIPAGTVIREVAILDSAVVDSTSEPGD